MLTLLQLPFLPPPNSKFKTIIAMLTFQILEYCLGADLSHINFINLCTPDFITSDLLVWLLTLDSVPKPSK